MVGIMGTFYCIPLSLSGVACILVGRNIGKGKVDDAILFGKQAFLINLIVCLIPSGILIFSSRDIARIFTDNEEVIGIVVPALEVTSVGFLIDSFQAVLMGVIKGLGK